ncbi:DUF3052 family protein [Kitasatospora sp. NPDC097643]|uniref:DUF3052 family protein n=1 Tax=Kitasatospora sp. NPDC097643 TaxID=3157230 RepID=UPI00333039D4
MAGSGDERADRATRLGFEPGMVVREIGYGPDIDHDLHDSVNTVSCLDLFDMDFEGLADAILLWFRAEDDDLADTLAYALDELGLGERGLLWLLTPKPGRAGDVEPSAVETATRARGLSRTETISVAEHWNGSCFVLDGH